MGALFGGVKPKNLILAAAAAAGIAQSGLGGTQQVVVLLLLILVASSAIIAPVAVYFLMGAEKAARILDGWKAWLQANNSAVMIVLFVVFGVGAAGQGNRRALTREHTPVAPGKQSREARHETCRRHRPVHRLRKM